MLTHEQSNQQNSNAMHVQAEVNTVEIVQTSELWNDLEVAFSTQIADVSCFAGCVPATLNQNPIRVEQHL